MSSQMRETKRQFIPFEVRFPNDDPLTLKPCLSTSYLHHVRPRVYPVCALYPPPTVYHLNSNHIPCSHKILPPVTLIKLFVSEPSLQLQQNPPQLNPLPEPLSQPFPKLLNSSLIIRVQPEAMSSPLPKGYNPNLCCAFVMDAQA